MYDYISKDKINFKNESFVIGLEGEWGIGKTWILDKLKAKLKNSGEYKNNVISLNVWMSFGYEYFIKNFYIELRDKCLGCWGRIWDFLLNSVFKSIINDLVKSDKKIENIYFILTLLTLGIVASGGWFFIDKYNWDWRPIVIMRVFVYLILMIVFIWINRQKNYSEIKEEIQQKINKKFEKALG